MNKICTSLEQSKKLLELGIDVNTADMYYDVNSYGIQGKPEVAVGKVWSKDIPAWTLSALLELMPKEIEKMSNLSFGYYDDRCDYVDKWCFNYVDTSNKDDEGEEIPIIEVCYADNTLDAVFDMIVKLKTQKII